MNLKELCRTVYELDEYVLSCQPDDAMCLFGCIKVTMVILASLVLGVELSTAASRSFH